MKGCQEFEDALREYLQLRAERGVRDTGDLLSAITAHAARCEACLVKLREATISALEEEEAAESEKRVQSVLASLREDRREMRRSTGLEWVSSWLERLPAAAAAVAQAFTLDMEQRPNFGTLSSGTATTLVFPQTVGRLVTKGWQDTVHFEVEPDSVELILTPVEGMRAEYLDPPRLALLGLGGEMLEVDSRRERLRLDDGDGRLTVWQAEGDERVDEVLFFPITGVFWFE